MSRDIDSNDRLNAERDRNERSERSAPSREPRRPENQTPPSRERESFEVRGYRYQVSRSELETMREVGRFRTIAVNDLAQYQYRGNTAQIREDLKSLRAQGLVEIRTAWTAGKREKVTVAVLTKAGKELLERQGSNTAAQQLYAGFVKPAEVAHDAAIYRMYQVEAERIENAGGRIRRIILDYELKKQVYTPLANARAKKSLSPTEYSRRQAEVASQNRLKVVRGKILLPDLRIEYETREGGGAHVDLELATHHYRGSHMRGKAEAGFKMYAPQGSVGRLTAALDPEFAAEIFSF